MNKYQYYINSKPVSKKEMIDRLKHRCLKVNYTYQAGLIGVDVCEFDEKEFNRLMRHICDPSYCCVIVENDSFMRKKL